MIYLSVLETFKNIPGSLLNNFIDPETNMEVNQIFNFKAQVECKDMRFVINYCYLNVSVTCL